ncbi:zinc finger, RING-type protein [Pseudohyphozyma bogoriensis]|nr:zinc finger, RING-type protein [Pseudohyphozyma bogoriensis]
MGQGGGGLQGVIPNWSNKSKGKKWGVKMSHPKRVEDGFSRDIKDPDDDEPAPAPKKRKGAKGAATPAKPKEDLVPGCASCLEPLLLAQAGLGRPWALKCGHVVCGRCVGDAKMRCEEIKANERKDRWVMDVDGVGAGVGGRTRSSRGKGKGKEVLLLDDSDDDADDDGNDSINPPLTTTTNSMKGGKGKEKSRAGETGVEEAWTTCPVAWCDGNTDLLAKEGSYNGAFELFV